MRRKPNALLSLEVSILSAAMELECNGTDEFHGYGLAKHIRQDQGGWLLTAYGTLYFVRAKQL